MVQSCEKYQEYIVIYDIKKIYVGFRALDDMQKVRVSDCKLL